MTNRKRNEVILCGKPLKIKEDRMLGWKISLLRKSNILSQTKQYSKYPNFTQQDLAA